MTAGTSLEAEQDPRERDLITRILVDATELARRIHSLDALLEDPVSVKQEDYVTLNDYQTSALLTSNLNRSIKDQIVNAALGLGGEAGEVAELLQESAVKLTVKSSNVLDGVKKYYFHDWSPNYYAADGAFDKIQKNVAAELGDLLWYIAVLSHLFGLTLGEIAKINRMKLIDRHGKLHTKIEGGEVTAPDNKR